MYASVENDSLSVGATFVIIDNARLYPFSKQTNYTKNTRTQIILRILLHLNSVFLSSH